MEDVYVKWDKQNRVMHFLINEWSTSKCEEEVGARTLNVPHGNNRTQIEVVAEKILPSVALQLWSNQEDANT